MPTRREFLKLGIATAAAGAATQLKWSIRPAFAAVNYPQTPLAAKTIPKFVEAMPVFTPATRVTGNAITVSASELQWKILPASFYAGLAAPFNAGAYIWAYDVGGKGSYYPGISIVAQRGVPTDVTYVNNLPLTGAEIQKYLTFDQSIHWAHPTGDPMMVPNATNTGMVGQIIKYAGPPPLVAHLHGAEVLSDYDGGPDQWFTPNGVHGPGYRTFVATTPNAAVYHYVNEQEATALWFHDHTLGATRLNVYAGLAAFYLLRDSFDTGLASNPLGLPAEQFEIEIALQDKQFDTNGQLLFPDGTTAGLNGFPAQPLIHPYWIPEFFGDVIVVNGKTWPYLEVEPRRYRFRLLDGCNARFLEMFLQNMATGLPGPAIYVIGDDGGLLDKPARLQSPKNRLLMAPGERYDVIIDFAGFAGQTLTLQNSAKAPYPMGANPDPNGTGQLLQFRVTKPLSGADGTYNPATGGALRKTGSMAPIERLANPATGTANVTPDVTRALTLVEIAGPAGPIMVTVNNTCWDGTISGSGSLNQPITANAQNVNGNFVTESPRVGSTEIWEIINLTMDAHPIHLHLTQFQLINRQPFQLSKYRALYDSLFPGSTGLQFPDPMGMYPPDTLPGVIGTKGPTATWGPVKYPKGVFIPTYGPPLDYNTLTVQTANKLGGNPDVTPFLNGAVMPPKPEEAGWKDVVQMYPGQVTRIAVRFAPQDVTVGTTKSGDQLYGFNPTDPNAPGYVWHCHIVDHEDNEMMRPYLPKP